MRLKERLIKESFRQFIRSEKELHPLKYLFWECTLRCNLSCLHCGSDCSVNSRVPDMPAEVFLHELQELAKKTNPSEITVVLTGGEPLVRPDLPDIGMAIRKLGFRWGMVTNGMGLDRTKLMSLVNAGLGAITLSFDGLEQEHNWLRNHPAAFRQATEALEQITSFKRLHSDVVTCVNKKTLPHLKAIRDFLISKGMKKWRLFTITPIGRAKEHPELHLSPSEIKEMMDFIVQSRLEEPRIETHFSCESYIGSYELKARDALFFCRAGIHIGSILADGSVSACPNIDRRLIQGHIREKPFVDIWETSFESFRDRSWTRKGICANCRDYKWCEGNGLHWWDMENHELLRCHWQDLKGI